MGRGRKKNSKDITVPKFTDGKNPAAPGMRVGKRVAALPPRPELLRFRFDAVDIGGPWCPSLATPGEWVMILTKLRDFETMKVHEAFTAHGYPGKDYANMHKCPNREALRRLAEIGKDDVNALSRLRLGSSERLYGIRNGPDFSILWWDPQHEVWP